MSSLHRQFKDRLYEQFARLGKALSAPRRLELLDLLCQGPRTVEALARHTSMSVANASQHLRVLHAARLVDADKRGLHVEYRLAGDDVSRLFVELRALAASRLAEVERVTRDYLERRGVMDRVDSEQLLHRVRTGDVVVVDVRPADEYRAGHIPGAISMPVADIATRVAELPRDRTIVAYCRGPYCVMAVDAVEVLRSHGFDAAHIDLGVPDWRARGFPVEANATREMPS